MRKIGLLFGSFNPLHNGHIAVARAAQTEERLDDVWFVVQPTNPYKPTFDLLTYETRVQLINQSGLTTYQPTSTDYEHYILDTLKELASYNLTLILGADLLSSFPSWHDYDEIMKRANIYQSHRIDDISSGLVRDRLQNNQPIDDLVPQVVAIYLRQHQRSDSDSPQM